MLSTIAKSLVLIAVLCLCAKAHAQDILTNCKNQVSRPSADGDKLAKAVFDARQLLYDQKPDEALASAQALLKQYPNDSNALAVSGEVAYRRGELSKAADAINKAVSADPCNARAHYDAWQFFTLTGMLRTAAQQLALAHQLDAQDTVIDWAWQTTRRRANAEAEHRCRITGTPGSTSIPIDARGNGRSFNAGATVATKVNGKSMQLIVDSGDSGITLTEDEAKSAGLTPGPVRKSAAHGATGDSAVSSYNSVIKTLQIGPVTFQDCPVNVVVDSPVTSGGIGLKLLQDFLITLDIQHNRIQLAPLPPLPNTDDPHDRFIAPSMSTWVRFYQPFTLDRIVLPVELGNAGTYLFILDTGAPKSHIDQDAAREVTTVTRDNSTRVSGYGGEEKNVFEAQRVPLRVGGVSRTYEPMLAYSRAGKSQAAGVRISGNVGWDLVRDTIVSIDYRDLLINFQPYGPAKK